ncbi:MAG: sigma-70 family RNA polymerase sigma factor [Oscillospiraceae bacterium]|nr:sigma-70 family RNA polymerase sigma factor [Oscillospiraceae bacterium]
MDAEQSKRIEELYQEMFEKLRSYAFSSLDNEALAEEAVQETFRIACQKPEKLCDSPNSQGWLVQTLKYTIRNIQSNRATAKRIIEKYLMTQIKEFSFSEDRLDFTVLYENVADTEEFKLLSEMAIEGRSHLEMADSRGISVSACKKRVQRAKETLQRKINI